MENDKDLFKVQPLNIDNILVNNLKIYNSSRKSTKRGIENLTLYLSDKKTSRKKSDRFTFRQSFLKNQDLNPVKEF